MTRAGKDADLAPSTCQRYIRDGILTEIVELDGGGDHLSDEEIEKFVASFPIKAAPITSAIARPQAAEVRS
jgi:hypothetical protein